MRYGRRAAMPAGLLRPARDMYTGGGRSAMAIESTVTAQEMGRVLAEAARDEPRIVEIWGAKRPDAIQLWVITTPITMDEHRSLYRLVDMLYEHFPEALFEVWIKNPLNYTKDVRRTLPRDAERFFDRAKQA
jgi:hypothetical protein